MHVPPLWRTLEGVLWTLSTALPSPCQLAGCEWLGGREGALNNAQICAQWAAVEKAALFGPRGGPCQLPRAAAAAATDAEGTQKQQLHTRRRMKGAAPL